MSFDKKVVIEAATNHWDEIFYALAPSLSHAQEIPGKHVSCPVHGGTDGFRLFPDYKLHGAGICNTCGPKTDGFAILMWLHNWTFPEALDQVAQYLGLSNDTKVPPTLSPISRTHPQENKVYEGKILFLGYQFLNIKGQATKTFLIKLEDKTGRRHSCIGTDLKRAASEAKVRRGDWVQITHIDTQVFASSKNETRQKHLWTIKPLTHLDSVTPTLQSPQHSAVENLWALGVPINQLTPDCPLSLYLESRGIPILYMQNLTQDSIKFCSETYYKAEDNTLSQHPAMLCAVRDVHSQLVTLHRTYLTHSGQKASVQTPKRLMALQKDASINGASIQFGKPDDVLCIAEGVETALSVQWATYYPCWATISAQGMKTVEIPQHVKTIFIFADKDKSHVGREAADMLRQRLLNEGRLAVIISIEDDIPTGQKGIDWNDILKLKGPDAFPLANPNVDQ